MTVRRLSTRSAGFADALASLLAFESAQDPAVDTSVAGIVEDVKQRGDAALVEYTHRFDRFEVASAAALRASLASSQVFVMSASSPLCAFAQLGTLECRRK